MVFRVFVCGVLLGFCIFAAVFNLICLFMGEIHVGLRHVSEMRVAEGVTAGAVGSGDLPVLATPMMLALMENAAMLAVAPVLPEGCTTVGGRIASSHLCPSAVGDLVRAEAEVTRVEGRRIEFRVAAYSGERLLGEGTHLRFVVSRERFLAGLAAR